MLGFVIGLALGSFLAPQVKAAGKELGALIARTWERVAK